MVEASSPFPFPSKQTCLTTVTHMATDGHFGIYWWISYPGGKLTWE